MKTPAPALVLGVAGVTALLAATRRPRRFVSEGQRVQVKRGWAYRATPLLLFFAAYWLLAINMHLNIGHRHILPTYPIVYILASASALWLLRGRRRWVALGLTLMLVLHAAESLRARPFYLAYFQPLVGGSERAYRFFVDSSLDWGQGLPDLAAWQRTRHESGDRASLFVSYSGVDLPRRHGITATRFGDEHYDLDRRSYPARLHGGWFVISATQFQRVYLPVRGPWTRAHEALYGEINQRLAARRAGDADPAGVAARAVRDARDYELLQFARLCHFLRQREPDEVLGASLLVFRLTDAEVDQALYAPADSPAPAASAAGSVR